MNVKPIRTKSDYRKAMKRLEEIFDAKPGSVDGDELEVLSILIEKYESNQFIVDYPDPIEAIKFRMEQLGYRPTDLAHFIGHKSRVSEILHKKRRLTVEMISILSKKLKIPAEVLIQ